MQTSSELWRHRFDKFKGYFQPKFIDIDNQRVTKKFPWRLIFGWILGTIAFIVMLVILKPNFDSWSNFWSYIGNFFKVGVNAQIGDQEITPMDTFLTSLDLLWRTIIYSLSGTFLGVVISVPLALLSSKNVIRKAYIYYPFRALMSIVRAIPPIVIAYIFYFVVSPSLAATLAVAVFVSSLMTKWLYEDLDTYDVSNYYSMQAIGNNKYLAFKKAIFPYLLKRIISYGFYSFEMVVRFAAILSIVGISTIGTLLIDDYGTPDNFSHLSIVLWVLIIFMIFMEFMNYFIKKYILEFTPRSAKLDKTQSLDAQITELKTQKPKNYYWKIILGIVTFVLILYSLIQIEWASVNEVKLALFKQGVKLLFTPDWSLFSLATENNVISQGLIAFVIAIVSSVIGLVLALCLGLLASKNIVGKFLCLPFKLIIIIIRAIPPFTMALLCLLLVKGSESFAGALALGIHSVGMLGKLINDSIEKIDPKILQSLDSVGVSRFHKIKYGVFKQIMPQTISNFLYRVEINFKTTVVIGAVGASPFGFNIAIYSADIRNWDKLSSYLIFIIVVLLILEQISNIIRKKLMTGYFFSQNFFFVRKWREYVKLKAVANSYVYPQLNYINSFKNCQYVNALALHKKLYLNSSKSLKEHKQTNKQNAKIYYTQLKSHYQQLRKLQSQAFWAEFKKLIKIYKVNVFKILKKSKKAMLKTTRKYFEKLDGLNA
ncbi:PhnE/PtxC family ABC transporter permease [[Mycoplasma] gypis]|uniref:ABC transporter permease subunit n=1 Tax=[Mycoplasma] gypis TaxID=92404 RepID=A0ABZ2RPP7_9BACT|nr:ABC transporter permease subunit [[Mycoplasma] gypis]MBN0919216.1 ABC transporter permease subunit [[Mycoplasma] gypis]